LPSGTLPASGMSKGRCFHHQCCKPQGKASARKNTWPIEGQAATNQTYKLFFGFTGLGGSRRPQTSCARGLGGGSPQTRGSGGREAPRPVNRGVWGQEPPKPAKPETRYSIPAKFLPREDNPTWNVLRHGLIWVCPRGRQERAPIEGPKAPKLRLICLHIGVALTGEGGGRLRRKTLDCRGLGGPRRPRNPSKRRGAKPPPF